MTMAEYLVLEGVLQKKALTGLWTISAKSSRSRTNSAPSGIQATTADAAGDDDEDDEDIATVFPEVVCVSLLLEKSSLPLPRRITILIQRSYPQTIRAIGSALRSAFSESDLRRLDRFTSGEVVRSIWFAECVGGRFPGTDAVFGPESLDCEQPCDGDDFCNFGATGENFH